MRLAAKAIYEGNQEDWHPKQLIIWEQLNWIAPKATAPVKARKETSTSCFTSHIKAANEISSQGNSTYEGN